VFLLFIVFGFILQKSVVVCIITVFVVRRHCRIWKVAKWSVENGDNGVGKQIFCSVLSHEHLINQPKIGHCTKTLEMRAATLARVRKPLLNTRRRQPNTTERALTHKSSHSPLTPQSPQNALVHTSFLPFAAPEHALKNIIPTTRHSVQLLAARTCYEIISPREIHSPRLRTHVLMPEVVEVGSPEGV